MGQGGAGLRVNRCFSDTARVYFWRRHRTGQSAPRTLGDVIRHLPDLDTEATIYAQEPWKPSSPALLRIQDLEANEGLFFDDCKYLLEVDLACDAVDIYEKWRRDEGLETLHNDRLRAVIHYATYDAYLPVHPPEPPP